MRINMIEIHPDADVSLVKAELARLGQWATALRDASGQVRAFSIDPSSAQLDPQRLERIPGVSMALGGQSPHPLVDQLGRGERSVGGFTFGVVTPWRAGSHQSASTEGRSPLLVAGPCSFETEELVHQVAGQVAAAGGKWLRGGAYKPRTSPYSFQGVGEEGLRWARAAADEHGLHVVTEALSEEEVDLVAQWSDIIQIGTRNMQNFALLKRVGRSGKPILLKRGLCATIDEWLLAGEYVMKHGAEYVVFCERGIRHYDQSTRNLLDLGAAALLKNQYGLPVIVDPSHATGRRDLIQPLAIAAIAMGIDGVMVETHPDPGEAKSDAAQALSPNELYELSVKIGVLPHRNLEGTDTRSLPFTSAVTQEHNDERTTP